MIERAHCSVSVLLSVLPRRHVAEWHEVRNAAGALTEIVVRHGHAADALRRHGARAYVLVRWRD